MAEDMPQVSDPLHARAQVRIFTIADYISAERSGKLYISGAGLEWTGVPARPNPDETGSLVSFHLAIRLAFPRAIARESHAIEVFLKDQAGEPAGPESLLKATMRFDLRRAPEDFSEVSGNLPVQVVDYPTRIAPGGIMFLHLMVDDVLVSRLPVELRPTDD